MLNKEYRAKDSARQLSKSCNAAFKIGGDNPEGTHYYICTKCDEACDADSGARQELVPLDEKELNKYIPMLLLKCFIANTKDATGRLRSEFMSKHICATFGTLKNQLVPLDEELLISKAKAYCRKWYKSTNERDKKLGVLICFIEEIIIPCFCTKQVSITDIKNLVSLKLSQMCVDDSPDRLGIRKSDVIAEAVNTLIYGKEEE